MLGSRSRKKPLGKLFNPFESSSDEDEDTSENTMPRRAQIADRALTLNIGGFDVVCLNSMVRPALLLGDATIKFIDAWVVPFVKKLALSQDAKASTSDSSATESAPSLASFQFTANPTPNLRENDTWNPCSHSWNVAMTGDTKDSWNKFMKGDHKRLVEGPHQCSILVDLTLGVIQYEAGKADAYRRAVAMWHAVDKSKRQRIGVTFAQE